MKKLRYIFPKTENFRETRPVICWEHMYGWLDGYGMLFDPIVQSATGVIPQSENGWNGRAAEGDFLVTACQQASECFTNLDIPGIYVRPELKERISVRVSEKEQLLTPVGEYSYPSHLPFDYYGASGEAWKIGESAALLRKKKSLALGFELFAMVGYWNGDWPERRLTAGADILTSILAELGFTSPGNSVSGIAGDDMRIDFQAYGINRLFIEWLIDINRADNSALEFADTKYLDAVAKWRKADITSAGKNLKAAFSRLADIRKQISALEIHFLEFPHMGILFEDKGFFELEWPQYSRETILSYLKNVEDKNYRVSLEAGASCWRNLELRFPSLVDNLKSVWREHKIELTNGTFSLPYALLSPLGMQYWQFEHGGKIFQEVFGMKPELYQCQENSLTAQMPELLLHFGYKQALHITQNHGQAPAEETDFIRWASPAGHALPAMTVKNISLSRKGVNYFLDLPLIHTEFKKEKKPFNYVNFQDIGYVPFRIQMIRAHCYADVWGTFSLATNRFESSYLEVDAPVKTYFADSYKISASAFYGDATNVNAFSHYETIFRLWARFRKLRFAAFRTGALEHMQSKLDSVIPDLCLLEAHDSSYVQGQRRGEFYAGHKTIVPPPYSRETLTAKVAEISGRIVEKINSLEKELCRGKGVAQFFNPSEVTLPFTAVCPEIPGSKNYLRNVPAMGTVPIPSSAGTYKTVPLPIRKGKWLLDMDADGAMCISYGGANVRCRPVDRQRGYSKLVESEAFECDGMNIVRINYLCDSENVQTVLLKVVFAEDSPFIEFNLSYAPRNNFDPLVRWNDYLALEIDFGQRLEKVWRFNPNVRSLSAENRIASPYYLAVETSDSRQASLINEGSFLYELDRASGKVNWLFHVANETVAKRRMGFVFGTDDAFMLSRAWSQGVTVVKAAEPQAVLKTLANFNGQISLEDFVAPDTLLISNLKDKEVGVDVESGLLEAVDMVGGNLMTSDGRKLCLNALEMAMLKIVGTTCVNVRNKVTKRRI